MGLSMLVPMPVRDSGSKREAEACSLAQNEPLLGIKAISSHLLALGYPQKSLESIQKCGDLSQNKIIMRCECSSKIKILPYSCNLRVCPRCSQKRKRRIFRDYSPILAKYNTNPRNRDFLYFLTISPANYPSFREGLSHIRKSFSKFVRNKYVKDRIRGGFYVLETKKSDKGWHVHLHAIIYGRWLDNKVRVANTDSKIVTIFTKCSSRACNVHIQRQSSSDYTLNYMLKYISSRKEDFNSVNDFAQYVFDTRKQKLITKFGEFFSLKIVKQICYCEKCFSPIQFIYDLELIAYMEKELNSPTPPPDLFDYSPLEI